MQKTAILLAEVDFRKRLNKGQVRIQFHGPSAIAFTEKKLSIGDEVTICLKRARRIDNEAGISTPGKSVDMELLFDRYLTLEV